MMNRLDESYVSVSALERAFEESTLDALVSDYVLFGGEVEDLYEVVKQSNLVTTNDLDSAVQYLKDNNLLEVTCHEEDERCYALSEEDDNLDGFTRCVAPEMCNVMEDLDDTDYDNMISVDFKTVEDLISGAVDNMSSEQLDDEIRLFKKIGKTLGVDDYDKVVVYLDDGEYNPDYVLSDGVPFKHNDRTLKYYKSANLISELWNGDYFLYFKTEVDLKKYYALANKFLNSDELSKNVFDYDEKHAEEWSERHPHGYYNDEGDYNAEEEFTPATIEEALNVLDKRTGNKFNLLNFFLEGKFSIEDKNKLVEMLNSNEQIETIHKHLTEAGGQYIDEEKEFKDMLMDRIHSGYNGPLTVRFLDPFAQQKVMKWLRLNRFEFESIDNELTIFIENNKSTEDMQVDVAKEIKDKLLGALQIINSYIDGKYNTNLQEAYRLMKNATDDCKDYLL